MAAPGIAVNRVSILHNMSGRRFLARRSERDLAITYTTFRYPVLVNQIIELFDDAIQKQMRFHRGIVLSQAKQPSPPPPPFPEEKMAHRIAQAGYLPTQRLVIVYLSNQGRLLENPSKLLAPRSKSDGHCRSQQP